MDTRRYHYHRTVWFINYKFLIIVAYVYLCKFIYLFMYQLSRCDSHELSIIFSVKNHAPQIIIIWQEISRERKGDLSNGFIHGKVSSWTWHFYDLTYTIPLGPPSKNQLWGVRECVVATVQQLQAREEVSGKRAKSRAKCVGGTEIALTRPRTNILDVWKWDICLPACMLLFVLICVCILE